MAGLDPVEMANFIMYPSLILWVAEARDTFPSSFPSPSSLYMPKLQSRLAISWITAELPLSHSMHQPYLVSRFHSVTPLWQWILQVEYAGCKTAASPFALCLLAITFSFLTGVSTVSHFLAFGTLSWVLSGSCYLLYLDFRSCSIGFTAAICPPS